MRVVLDGVFNHSGRGFWPFHHVVENGSQSPYVDWFYVNHEALAAGRPLRAYPSLEEGRALDDAAAAEVQRRGDVSVKHLGYRAWWDLPALPKLNTDNPFMREHLMSAAEHWLRVGIDGWRLDVAEEIDAGFWREFRERVRAANPDAYIVAEIWREKPEWLTGDTFDALMNYPLTEALLSFTAARQLDMDVLRSQHEYRDFVRPTDGPGFAAALEHLVTMYRPESIAAQLNLLGSHDTARYVTIAGGDTASFRLALLAIMTLPGAPCIYYGDEIGLEGSHDPDSRRAFPWDEARWDRELLEFCRAATALRHARPVLRHGDYRTLAASGNAVAYARMGDGDVAVVVLNAGDEGARLSFESADLAGRSLAAADLPGARLALSTDGDRVVVEIGPRAGGVLLSG
ncbi:glycoside hydrolase family 13 protein [soil metagenome]